MYFLCFIHAFLLSTHSVCLCLSVYLSLYLSVGRSGNGLRTDEGSKAHSMSLCSHSNPRETDSIRVSDYLLFQIEGENEGDSDRDHDR